MSKAVMISIQPKWCELIASGKKTIEVRKTRPKIDTPFKCYIYATKPKKWFRFSSWGRASDENLWLSNGKVKMCDGFEFWADGKEYEPLCGKVIGEFVCDFIVDGKAGVQEWEYICENSKLSCKEIYDYCGEDECGETKYCYGWHISDLVIYDKPRDIGEFESAFHCFNLENVEVVENAFGDYVVKYYDNSFCRICKYYNGDFGDCDKRAYQPLTRAPQSWCYVEAGNE